jgi:hypothetical protein
MKGRGYQDVIKTANIIVKRLARKIKIGNCYTSNIKREHSK